MRPAAAALFVLWLTACSSWSTRDQAAMGFTVALHFVDARQTSQVLADGGLETNPLLGERPSDTSLVLLKAGALGVTFLLCEAFPDHKVPVMVFSGLPTAYAVLK